MRSGLKDFPGVWSTNHISNCLNKPPGDIALEELADVHSRLKVFLGDRRYKRNSVSVSRYLRGQMASRAPERLPDTLQDSLAPGPKNDHRNLTARISTLLMEPAHTEEWLKGGV